MTLRATARAWGDERGQIAIGFALLIVVVFMFFALAFDAGLWYFDHRLAQNQVDAAAHAGALELPDVALAEASAITYLKQNGIANPTDPANLCPGKPAAHAWDENGDGKLDVEVCQRRASGVVFSALSDVTGAMVSARAVATQYLEPVRYAIMVMDPDECQAFKVSGNNTIVNVMQATPTPIPPPSGTPDPGGKTLTRSRNGCSPGALSLSGNATLNGVRHDVNGNADSCGGCTLTGPVTEYADVTFEDPWLFLPRPALPPSSSCIYPPAFNGNQNYTLFPGRYCDDITVSNRARVTVRPGEYVLTNGAQLDVSPSAPGGGNSGFFCSSWRAVALCDSSDDQPGGGVVFYSTCDPTPCAGTPVGRVRLGGAGKVRLAGHPGYDHILVWLDRYSAAVSSAVTITGGSNTELNGHVYAFSSDVNVQGNSAQGPLSLNVSILANTLAFAGGATITLVWNEATAPKIQRLALIE